MSFKVKDACFWNAHADLRLSPARSLELPSMRFLPKSSAFARSGVPRFRVVTLARIVRKTKRIKFGPAVLIPRSRHPMAQASAIATLEQLAGTLMVGFGTGFTGGAGMGMKPLSLASMHRISRRFRCCCGATLPISTAVSPRSSRPTAGCPIRSTCQSAGQAGRPSPQGSSARQGDCRRPDFPRRPGRRVRDLPRYGVEGELRRLRGDCWIEVTGGASLFL